MWTIVPYQFHHGLSKKIGNIHKNKVLLRIPLNGPAAVDIIDLSVDAVKLRYLLINLRDQPGNMGRVVYLIVYI